MHPTIGLTMIVRNEARCIARCIQSAQSVVDSVTVCDTGSTDGTVEIARNLGAHVVHAVWQDDFSAARNVSLDHSQADWNLVLDADEWLDSGVTREQLQVSPGTTPFVGLITVRSAFAADGRSGQAEAWLPRLLPSGVRYHGRIHEQPAHQLKQRALDVLVHHDGYEPAQAAKKLERNEVLLHAELKRQPNSSYHHFQFAVHLASQDRWPEALHSFMRSVALGGMSQPFAHELAVNLIHAQCRCQQFRDAIDLVPQLQQRWPASSDIHFAIGNLYLDVALAHPADAVDCWLPAAQQAWLTCLEIGEHGQGDVHVMGRGSYLAAHNLAVVYEGLGRSSEAQHYRQIAATSPLSH